METAVGFIFLILIVVILGAGGYYAYDYMQYKKKLDDQIATAQKNITTNQQALVDEQKKRLSNLKYVVNQINDTNLDIYNTFTSNVVDSSNVSQQLNTRQTQMLNGLGSVMRFSAGASVAGGTACNIDLLSLPGAPTANIELLRRVSTINGMDFNQLNATNPVKFCGPALTGGAARCIQLPNADGKTVLTNIIDNKPILMDGMTEFSSNITLMNIQGGMIDATSTTKPLTLRSNRFIQIGNQLNLGDEAAALRVENNGPYMSINVNSANKDALQVSTATASNVIRIDPTGKLMFNDKHSIHGNSDGRLAMRANGGLVIQTDPAQNNQAIELTANSITLNGTVNIQGNLRVNGQAISTAGTTGGTTGGSSGGTTGA
jgi:hypothetical protein